MADVGDLWLEQAFGWRPLMMDIEDAIKAYNALFLKDRVVKVSVGATDYSNHPWYPRMERILRQYCSSGVHPTYSTEIRDVQLTSITRIRGAVVAKAKTTAQGRLQSFGFTPEEFVPTAWELLPWSFLADYFANIGDILSAFVTDTSSIAWTSKSNVRIVDQKIWTRHENWWGSAKRTYSLTYSPGYLHWRKKTISRRNSARNLIPPLTFRLPTSDGKLLNIAALLTGVNRRLHPQNPRPYYGP